VAGASSLTRMRVGPEPRGQFEGGVIWQELSNVYTPPGQGMPVLGIGPRPILVAPPQAPQTGPTLILPVPQPAAMPPGPAGQKGEGPRLLCS